MRKIKILADSSCDLPKDIVSNLGIDVIPLKVMAADGEYLDGVSITSNEVFSRINDGEMFTTSQCSVNELSERYTKYLNEGYDVIYVAISSKLSGCYNAGVLAKEIAMENRKEGRIHVIDSLSGSMGTGWIIIKAAQMAIDGCSFDEIVSDTVNLVSKSRAYITVDNLDCLIRGGRISKSVGMIANTLDIKPVLTVIDGSIVSYPKGSKQRGMKKCIGRILDIMEDEANIDENSKVAICYGYDRQKADLFAEHFRARFNRDVDVFTQLGCAIGVHGGPTAFAVFVN